MLGVSVTTADGFSVLADRIASELRMELAPSHSLFVGVQFLRQLSVGY
jgi:hypothetical protein